METKSKLSTIRHDILKNLPSVDRVATIFEQRGMGKGSPRSLLTQCIRSSLARLRQEILNADSIDAANTTTYHEESIIKMVASAMDSAMSYQLKQVVNATGVIVHTNLGRSLLSKQAIEHITKHSGTYSSLEFDLEQGARGSRYRGVEKILCELTRAEAAIVVNNNAAAVFLALNTLAEGQEAIVSRGELVEIGGSFRIPDVMAKSGVRLVEVGTTNRTWLPDYEQAITSNTALLLKVHTSNYSIVGFTAEVLLADLVALGRQYQIPVMNDLGSGSFIDFTQYGLPKEPTVQEAIKAGADIVTFSGDKLLGGPQSGIILGKKELIEKIKKNPLNRAFRIDKMTIAGLEATLHLYRDEQKAISDIPTLRMLTLSKETIKKRAKRLKKRLDKSGNKNMAIRLIDGSSQAGGGALPLQDIPTVLVAIAIDGLSPNSLAQHMLNSTPPVVGRIEDNNFLLDLRTVQEREEVFIESGLTGIMEGRRL
ncbi:MAG: L-seryl-tRNA(Sec) selenium transferase [Pseudomonadota bacterium]